MVDTGITICGQIDVLSFPDNEIWADNTTAWVKSDVDEKLYSWRGRPAAVLKISSPLAARYCGDGAEFIPAMVMSLESGEEAIDVAFENQEGEEPSPVDGDPGTGEEASPTDPDKPEAPAATNPEDQLCWTEKTKFLTNMGVALDSYSINDKGYQGKALKPTAAAVPMRSNVLTYGPWVSDNFNTSTGGTNVRTEADLAPWVFGSYATMNTYGQKIANAIAVGANRVETGSVSLPGMPQSFTPGSKFTLGGSVMGGPNLSSFSFTLGSSGASCTYEFRTHTPKIGDMTRLQIDQHKENIKKRSQTTKFLREERLNNNKTSRRIANLQSMVAKANSAYTTNPTHKASLQRIMMGEIYDIPVAGNKETDNPNRKVQRASVGTSTFAGSLVDMIWNYGGKSYLSMDGMYSPVSISGGGGQAAGAVGPEFANWITPFGHYTNIQHSVKSAPTLPVPPVRSSQYAGSSAHNLEINQKYLNPLTNKIHPVTNPHHHAKGLDGTVLSGAGHNIEIVGRGELIPDGKGGLMNSISEEDSPEKYSTDYRFLGLRGPLVLHQWGYDLEGKPVPNAIDQPLAAKSGTFVNNFDFRNIDYANSQQVARTGLKDEFLKDWLGNPSTWPVGPIDLRWDRNRGVWVSPPNFKIVAVEATSEITEYGTGTGKLINRNSAKAQSYGEELFDEKGRLIKSDANLELNNTQITITDRLGAGVGTGTKGYAFYDGFTNEYLMLGGSSSGSSVVIGKFMNQWPSLSNAKDPRNAVKKVVLYKHKENCDDYGTNITSCPWALTPQTEVVNGIEKPIQVEAINLFSNVAAAEYQTKWCALVKSGAYYILLAAEC